MFAVVMNITWKDCAIFGNMAISKSTNTYNRQNWEDSVSFMFVIYKPASYRHVY